MDHFQIDLVPDQLTNVADPILDHGGSTREKRVEKINNIFFYSDSELGQSMYSSSKAQMWSKILPKTKITLMTSP